eukprot:g45868.t1
MSTKVKECEACGQGFSEDNQNIGTALRNACAPQHTGPIKRIHEHLEWKSDIAQIRAELSAYLLRSEQNCCSLSFQDNAQQVLEAEKLFASELARESLNKCLREPAPAKWKCFLSHVQKEAADACRALGRYLKDKNCSVWYDKEAGRLDLTGMVEGIAGSAAFVIYGTQSYFNRPWCLFELMVARKLGKTIITVRETDERHGQLSFAALSHYDPALGDHQIIDVSRDYYDAFVEKVLGRVLIAASKQQMHSADSASLGKEARSRLEAAAGTYRQALKYLYSSDDVAKDEARAIELLQEAADQGYAEAQFRLALCYRKGTGVSRDEKKAAALLQAAADQGLSDAQANLGFFYQTGKGGLPRDESKARVLFEAAAEQGSATGQANLGLLYATGKGGVEVDEKKALALFRQAANQGDATGQANLGDFYMYGKGGLQIDWAEARKLYQLAVVQGNPSAQAGLGWCFYKGKGGLEQDYKKAVELLEPAAEQGDARAQANLAVCYCYGNGVEKSNAKYLELCQLAAAQGSAIAQCNLGNIYRRGDELEKDMAKAVELYQLSAAQGYSNAQFVLGQCYQEGDGVEKDMTKAAQLYKLAAAQGHTESQCFLGHCFRNGDGVEKDLAKAAEMYKMAAEQKFQDAQYFLGRCYQNGDGLEKDLAKAVKFYKLAAAQGFPRAQFALGSCYENGDGLEKDSAKAVELYKSAAAQGHEEAIAKLDENSSSISTSVSDITPTISVTIHPHALQWTPLVYSGYWSCDACRAYGQGPVYHCGACGYDLHAHCAKEAAASTTQPGGATSATASEENKLASAAATTIQALARGKQARSAAKAQVQESPASHLEDDGHNHLLTYMTQVYNGKYVCNGCRRMGTGPVYHCAPCKYDLHPNCAKRREPAAAPSEAPGAPSPAAAAKEKKEEAKAKPAPEHAAAAKIQAQYRGYSTRKLAAPSSDQAGSEKKEASDSRHAHSLTYKEKVYSGRYKCDGCGQLGTGAVYTCEPCKWDLHPACVGKPAAAQATDKPPSRSTNGVSFKVICTKQSKADWEKLPLKEWDMADVLVGPGSSNVAIASWRWDVGSDHENSPNMARVVKKASSFPGIQYVLADIISLDQKDPDIIQKVVKFSDLYYHLQSVTSYGSGPESASIRARCWISNELSRMLYSRTPVKEICTEAIKSDSWFKTLPAILKQVGVIADDKSVWGSAQSALAIMIVHIPRYQEKLARVMELPFCDIFPASSRSYLVGMIQSPFVEVSTRNQLYLSDMLTVYTLWLHGEKGSSRPEVQRLILEFKEVHGASKFVQCALVLLLSLSAKYLEGGLMKGFSITPADWKRFMDLLCGEPPPDGREKFKCSVVEHANDDQSKKQNIGYDALDARREVNGVSQAKLNCQANYNFILQHNAKDAPYVETSLQGFATQQELSEGGTLSARERNRLAITRINMGGMSDKTPKSYSVVLHVLFGAEDAFACSSIREGRSSPVLQAFCGMLLQQIANLLHNKKDF